MDNPLDMPKQEDVTEVDLGEARAALVRITPENKDYLIKKALSMYLGECCKYCQKEYKTLDDLNDTVFAGYHEYGRLACKSCWDANNQAEP